MTVEIATLLLRLAIVLITGFLAPAFKKWVDQKTQNEKYIQLREAAETAVYAAEQMAKKVDPDGTERKRIAKHAISRAALRLGLALPDTEIEEILEAAVKELNLVSQWKKEQ